MDIINGTGKPQLKIIKLDASVVTITLPWCEELQEEWAPATRHHEIIDESGEVDENGFKINFRLSYPKLMRGTVLSLLGPLFSIDKSKVMLVPRLDVPTREYRVYLANAVQVARAGKIGHKGIVLQFRGLDILDGMSMVDTNNLSAFTTWGYTAETFADLNDAPYSTL